MGEGRETLFWHDNWAQEEALKITYPRLFRKALDPLATVAASRIRKHQEWVWEIPWACPLRIRDQENWNSLRALLDSVPFEEGQNDQPIWTLHKSGNFTVNSFYLELYKNSQPLLSDVLQKLWGGLVPVRIEVFFWLALMGKINTKVKLASHNIIPSSEVLCPLCSQEPEDLSHLFITCPFAKSLWGWWCQIWGLSWVWPSSLASAFEQWNFPCKNKFFKKIWTAVFQVILWSIWKERNNRTFNNMSNSVQETQNMILMRLCWWVKNWKESFPYSPTEVMRNPRCLRWQPPSIIRVRKSAQQIQLKHNQLVWKVGVVKTTISVGMRIGGYLHNTEGMVCCAFSSSIPKMEESSAEVIAVHRALQISLNNNSFKKTQLAIEIKSQRVVE